jgi:hypothetical protein
LAALGYLGGVAGMTSGAFLLRSGYGSGSGQAGYPAVVVASFFVAGWVLRTSPERALSQLGGVLWLFATAGVYWLGVAVGGTDAGLSHTSQVVTALLTCAVAAALWALRPRSAQVVGLWAATAVLLVTLLSGSSFQAHGIGLVLLGTAWFVVARTGVIRPEQLGSALGAVLLVLGPLLTSGPKRYVSEAAVAVILIALSVLLRETSLLVLGAVAIVISVGIYSFNHPDRMTSMRVLLLAGVGAVAVTVVMAWRRAGRDAPTATGPGA